MFDDTLFEVAKQPVYVKRTQWDEFAGNIDVFVEVPRQVEIVRTDTFETLSIMSKDYEPIQDMNILNRYQSLFNTAQIEITPIKHHITKSKDGVSGRRTYMEVELPAYTLFPNSAEEQKCRIVIPNSFDGTEALQMMIMFYRLVCKNGMMGWRTDFSFKIKHRKGAEERLDEAINLYLLEKMEQATTSIEILANLNGQTDYIMNYFDNNKILPGERWQEKLMGAWLKANQTTNLWELYNIFTNLITHNYGRNFGVKLNKYELLNREVKKVWGKVLGVPSESFAEQILIEG